MNKWLFPALTAIAVLQGCSSVPRGNIPVVDSSTRVSNSERIASNRNVARQPSGGTSQAQSLPEDSGVTVVIPQGAGAAPCRTGRADKRFRAFPSRDLSGAPRRRASGAGWRRIHREGAAGDARTAHARAHGCARAACGASQSGQRTWHGCGWRLKPTARKPDRRSHARPRSRRVVCLALDLRLHAARPKSAPMP